MKTQPKLVVIAPGNTYAAYSGRTRVDVATFNRPLLPDELEAFRLDPASLTSSDPEEGVSAA